MATAPLKRVAYDTDRIVRDMAKKGWEVRDLAQNAGVSRMTVGRFLRGEVQTVKTGRRIAEALGRAPGFYLRLEPRRPLRAGVGEQLLPFENVLVRR